jgi:hypothetical protein
LALALRNPSFIKTPMQCAVSVEPVALYSIALVA